MKLPRPVVLIAAVLVVGAALAFAERSRSAKAGRGIAGRFTSSPDLQRV
jgi:hypothetical protein